MELEKSAEQFLSGSEGEEERRWDGGRRKK
jgi:hypothetical protein